MYVFLSARWGSARQQTISHPTTVVFLCRPFSRASDFTEGRGLFECTPLERSQSTAFVFSHRTFNAGRVLTCTERSTPPPCPLLWPCPPSVLKLTEVKSSNRCRGEGAAPLRWPLRLKCSGPSRSGRYRCPALYVQEKVGTAAAAAAMATVGRVTDLETMGRQHSLSLNLLSCNMGSLGVSRGLYCYQNFDTITDDCFKGLL